MELDVPPRGSEFVSKEGVLLEFFVKAVGIAIFNCEASFTNDEGAVCLDVPQAMKCYFCRGWWGEGDCSGEIGKDQNIRSEKALACMGSGIWRGDIITV